jgi:hypothetical protein
MKTINELVQINEDIKKIEGQIDKNTREFMNIIYVTFKKLGDDANREAEKEIIVLSEYNVNKDKQFSLKFLDYEIIITYMNTFAIPKNEVPGLENENIFQLLTKSAKLQECYSSCIAIYFCNPSFNDNEILQYLNRIFITKDFKIVFQFTHEKICFSRKEEIIKDLEQILIGTLYKLFINYKMIYPDLNDIFTLTRTEIKENLGILHKSPMGFS